MIHKIIYICILNLILHIQGTHLVQSEGLRATLGEVEEDEERDNRTPTTDTERAVRHRRGHSGASDDEGRGINDEHALL